MPLLAPTPARLEDWVEQAELRSPEILALRAQLQAARHEVDKAQAAHLPSLDATAQWARSESENVLNVRSRYDNTALSVQLNIPIYAGGYVNSMVRQALAEHDRVEAMTEATRRDLGLRVHKEYRNITEGILRVQALAQAARSAEQLVVSSRKSFQAGSRTQLDILNAEQQRMLTLRDLAQARYVYLLSRVRLHALAGADKQSSIEEVNRWLQAETPPDRQ
jgi:outer membrane protein/protease secretion system outer membrane protein